MAQRELAAQLADQLRRGLAKVCIGLAVVTVTSAWSGPGSILEANAAVPGVSVASELDGFTITIDATAPSTQVLVLHASAKIDLGNWFHPPDLHLTGTGPLPGF